MFIKESDIKLLNKEQLGLKFNVNPDLFLSKEELVNYIKSLKNNYGTGKITRNFETRF